MRRFVLFFAFALSLSAETPYQAEKGSVSVAVVTISNRNPLPLPGLRPSTGPEHRYSMVCVVSTDVSVTAFRITVKYKTPSGTATAEQTISTHGHPVAATSFDVERQNIVSVTVEELRRMAAHQFDLDEPTQ